MLNIVVFVFFAWSLAVLIVVFVFIVGVVVPVIIVFVETIVIAFAEYLSVSLLMCSIVYFHPCC